MKQRKAPVTIKTISATDISNLAQQFTHDAHAPLPRGRKLLYPEALSLTLAPSKSPNKPPLATCCSDGAAVRADEERVGELSCVQA
jgi:hypothetical protein